MNNKRHLGFILFRILFLIFVVYILGVFWIYAPSFSSTNGFHQQVASQKNPFPDKTTNSFLSKPSIRSENFQPKVKESAETFIKHANIGSDQVGLFEPQVNVKNLDSFEDIKITHREIGNQNSIISDNNNFETEKPVVHRDGVVVLGMHRSGTSLLTGLLTKTGLFVGHPTALIWGANKEDNKKGFFERVDVVLQNDEILQKQQAHWSLNTQKFNNEIAIKKFHNGEYEWNHGEKGLIALNNPKHSPWVLKDPRLCITLPFWVPLFNTVPAIVFTYRNPVEVAKSLFHRENMPHKRSFLLWISYNQLAIKNSNGLCRVLTTNKELLSNSKGVIDRIVEDIRKCGVPVPHFISDQDFNEFVDLSLHRNRVNIENSNSVECLIPNWSCSAGLPPRACEEEKSAYIDSMRVFCALENGEAFQPSYQWPVLPPYI